MAAEKSQESTSSSSSSSSSCKYQVFLSFRGIDTRKTFTSHLYEALGQAGIHTFRDDDEIPRGENIELELKKAIEQSKIAIVVFSENYASSRWCLDELVMIMEQRRTAGWKVIPVFYHVDPSDVRKQTESFARAFVEHEKHFKKEMERVNRWRKALKEVADLAGMGLKDSHEASFVQSIVETVSKKLKPTKFHLPQHFIGRDAQIKDINSWLQSGSSGADIAMLYGIGGVGKSTIAKSIYNQHSGDFEATSFLSNIREKSTESNGLLCLQKQLLSDILNKTTSEIHDVDEGINRIKDALCCRRVLIILDDVDTRDQFNKIIVMRSWLCKGSKIIVTTRNKGLFAGREQCVKFKIEALNKRESIELFSWHAFQKPHPDQDFEELSKSMVRLCHGLPLALSVIGPTLLGKSTEEWESALQEMEMIPDGDIQKVLKISYDSLKNEYRMDLFLDIACFFVGMDEDDVVNILSGLGIKPTIIIGNLKDRCLIEIDCYKRISMHQLIKDMGRTIAGQESSKFQRIWQHKEAFNTMLENNAVKDTERVRGLILDMHHKGGFTGQYCPPSGFSLKRLPTILFGDGQTSSFPLLGTNAFKKMQNLKFLQLNYVKFDGGYQHFPESLLWLRWHGFSLPSIPKTFCLKKLLVLDMRYSNLVDVWKGKMSLPNLKTLNLSHSHGLLRTPDFRGLQCLEKLILEDCVSLVEIHESIGGLHNLAVLNLRGCISLEELPEEISQLNSLKVLLLVELNLSGTPIRCLPESLKGLTSLTGLYVRNCEMLQNIPELPNSVDYLDVDGCNSLEKVAHLVPLTISFYCEASPVQDLIKQELIKLADIHMLRLLEKVCSRWPRQIWVELQDNVFELYLAGYDDVSVFEKWRANEVRLPSYTRKLRGLSLCTELCAVELYTSVRTDLFVEIKSNANGVKKSILATKSSFYLFVYDQVMWSCHWKFPDGGLEFEDGDEVSVCVSLDDPAIQLAIISVEIIFEENRE